MKDNTYAVVMAGGKGERFWPLSTSRRPKQILSLVGSKPMLAMAVGYLRGLIPPRRIIVITSSDLVAITRRTLPGVPPANIIGEPFGRDTAAACALASAIVGARTPDGCLCMLTADHVIRDIPLFQGTLRESFDFAQSNDVLMTIGMKPVFPSTGFGYIEVGGPVRHRGKARLFKARRFVEKPDPATARRYIGTGRFYWNAGMFVWSVSSFQKALADHRPQLLEMAGRMQRVVGKPSFYGRLRKEYSGLEKISVDYAIMEKAKNIVMTEGAFRWGDVGAWSALADHMDSDKSGNVMVGACEAIDSANNVVVSRDRLTALVGVKDMVVVQAGGATLVCSKDKSQDVKKMVHLLRKKGKYRRLL